MMTKQNQDAVESLRLVLQRRTYVLQPRGGVLNFIVAHTARIGYTCLRK